MITGDGTLVIASASGSQLASYAWGAANVIFVVGAQKLVPTPEAARERIYQHSLVLEEHLVSPGMLVVGADSHTQTAGAAGSVAVAVGSTELATVLATGRVWLAVPETLRIVVSGRLPARSTHCPVTSNFQP